jgi:hypothetical protein
MHSLTDYPLLVFVLSFSALWLSARFGASFLGKLRHLEEDVRENFRLIVGATLTLLSLIIGFSFSMASRYDQRKSYEAEEANAIGTEYVRADLLPVADATRVRALLKKYLDQRVLFYTTRDDEQLRQINASAARLQTELWSAIQTLVSAQPTPIVGSLGCASP